MGYFFVVCKPVCECSAGCERWCVRCFVFVAVSVLEKALWHGACGMEHVVYVSPTLEVHRYMRAKKRHSSVLRACYLVL